MRSVRRTSELERVAALPRREFIPESITERMTECLKTDTGTMALRPVQALALYEAMTCGGLFAPIGVGEGKTLITLLAPYVLDAKRPLLLLPASLVQKTAQEREHLEEHWLIPKNIRLMSYQMLGLVQSEHDLEIYEPDLIVCDEVHKLKNPRTAVTRRVARYMAGHSSTKFIGLSGTIMRKSLLDFGHILRWCLKLGAPIPSNDNELEEWACALDEKVDEFSRLEPGALLQFCRPEELAPLAATPVVAARRGFRRRLVETPGVVAALGDIERVDVPLRVRAVRYDTAPITASHFAKLREAWLTPDDWVLTQAVDVWRHARELALGFHQIWDPRPPEAWREARRAWHSFVREVLSRSRTLDSELHVTNAVDAGKLSGGSLSAGQKLLANWRVVKDTFVPNPVAVWHDDSALRVCLEWMREPGIVWTEHVEFAQRLAQLSGADYYGGRGLTATGKFINEADPRRPAIVSIDANREGHNLQRKWSRNLITSMPEGWDVMQQVIGRTHRFGTKADEVVVEILLGCAEHVNAWRKCLAGTIAAKDTIGGEPKLLLAVAARSIEWPSDIELASLSGPRWERTQNLAA